MAWEERGASSASYYPSAPTKSSQANLKLKFCLCICFVNAFWRWDSQLFFQRGYLLSVSPLKEEAYVMKGQESQVKRETHTHKSVEERLFQAGRREAGGCPEPSPSFMGCGQPQVVTVLWNVIWLTNFWIFCLLVFLMREQHFGLRVSFFEVKGQVELERPCEPVVWTFQQKGVS